MASNENMMTESYDPKFYDLSFGDKKDDIPFYIHQAKEAGGKVLEVACGSGRVYLELLKEGVDAYGIDISEEMLSTLREKAKALNLQSKVLLVDMRDFEMEHKFSLIAIPFGSFLQNLTIDDQLSTLKSCRKHLNKNGKLVLNFFHPNPDIMANTYGKEIHQPIDTAEGQIDLVRKSYFVDEPGQVIEFTFTWIKDNQILSRFRSRLSLIYKREFELLLSLAGFKRWQVYGSFEYQALESYKQEMVWIIEK
jgi:ubiquinone/menaquinone biosynthesis C-methylase UbiE